VWQERELQPYGVLRAGRRENMRARDHKPWSGKETRTHAATVSMAHPDDRGPRQGIFRHRTPWAGKGSQCFHSGALKPTEG
jgi:hypothetical protein